ncbi:MAG: Phosphoglycerate kinase [candidate division TM6 bacterium GW2011_GWF2_32_72]|nr:MAG: Phosphoglycerate kinase [candidate division TM6 bacterium GW2011_GWF2_32_72]
MKCNLIDANLNGKRVFLRADLNLPIEAPNILNDFKLQSILPTIDLIQKKGGKVILATHLGRPKNHEPELSTIHLISWFKDHDYNIKFQDDLNEAIKDSKSNEDEILLLENLRFFPGEKNKDPKFAKQLKQLADFYVNDAFGVSHRDDASLKALPELFDDQHKMCGLLINKEILTAEKLINSPAHPFVLIIGGSKIADKIQAIQELLDKIDTLLLCPAIVFTFLKAQGKEVGNSLVDESSIELVKRIIQEAKQKKVEIIFPLDYIIAKDDFNGELSFTDKPEIPESYAGVTIGPKTIELFSTKIQKAKTVFYNGLMGDLKRPETLESVKDIFKAMDQSQGLSVIGGGESSAIATMYELNKNNQVSTGGGALLYFISHKKLPGLDI